MRKFPELRKAQFERFLEAFCRPGTLRIRNNKWIGISRDGRPFVVHVKHGSTRKYPSLLVEAVAKDLGVTQDVFWTWYSE